MRYRGIVLEYQADYYKEVNVTKNLYEWKAFEGIVFIAIKIVKVSVSVLF